MSGKVQPRAGSNISFRMQLSSQQIFCIPVCGSGECSSRFVPLCFTADKNQTNSCPHVKLQHSCELRKITVLPLTISLLFERITYTFYFLNSLFYVGFALLGLPSSKTLKI